MRSIVFVGILTFILLLTFQSYALEIKSYDISIERENNGYRVSEQVSIEKDNDTNILIWLQKEAKDIDIKINGSKANFSASGTLYIINLTNSKELEISVNYNLPGSTGKFIKQVLYKCKEFSAKLDGEIVYQGMNLSEGNYISFSIKEKIIEKENYYMYTTLILLLILIIVFAYSVKGKKRKEKELSASPELLRAKKDLLMNALKEIEKRYRAKELSEEIYSKLKEDFKREAVNVVRRLEEIEKD